MSSQAVLGQLQSVGDWYGTASSVRKRKVQLINAPKSAKDFMVCEDEWLLLINNSFPFFRDAQLTPFRQKKKKRRQKKQIITKEMALQHIKQQSQEKQRKEKGKLHPNHNDVSNIADEEPTKSGVLQEIEKSKAKDWTSLNVMLICKRKV
jgi:hypothetical protein